MGNYDAAQHSDEVVDAYTTLVMDALPIIALLAALVWLLARTRSAWLQRRWEHGN